MFSPLQVKNKRRDGDITNAFILGPYIGVSCGQVLVKIRENLRMSENRKNLLKNKEKRNVESHRE
jgi:hypothetical protein